MTRNEYDANAELARAADDMLHASIARLARKAIGERWVPRAKIRQAIAQLADERRLQDWTCAQNHDPRDMPIEWQAQVVQQTN